MVRRYCVLILTEIVLILCTVHLYADEKRLTASVQKTAITMDESVILTITAQGIEPEAPPQLPPINGVTVSYRGESTHGSSQLIIIVNGRQQVTKNEQSIIYQYELIPQHIGVFIIPSVEVISKGTRYSTAPITITVSKEAVANERDIFLDVALSQKECYVEQPVVLEVKWYFEKNIESYSLDIPFLPAFKNFIIKNIEPDPNRIDYEKIQYNDQVVDFFEKSSEVHNGRQFVTLTLRKIIVPAAAGSYTFDPVLLRCGVVKGYRNSGDQFDDFGFGGFFSSRRAVVEQRVVRSTPQTLIVNSLPPPPAGFSGNVSVGTFTMNVSASPREVKANDPITVTVVVSGEGNVDGISNPQVTDLKDFRMFQEDAKSDIKVTSSGIHGQKVFQTLLIPLSDRIKQIPPIKLAFFDTKLGQYRQLSSAPIPIVVTPAPVSSSPVIIEGKEKSAGKKEVQILHRDLPGYIKFSPGTFTIRKKYLYHQYWYYLLLVCPFVFNCLLMLYMKRYRRLKYDDRYRRSLLAKREAQRMLDESKKYLKNNDLKMFYTVLVHTLNEYVGSKLSIPSAGLTADVVKENLEKYTIDPEAIERVIKFYRDADMARFMPSLSNTLNPKDSVTELKHIINLLEKYKW